MSKELIGIIGGSGLGDALQAECNWTEQKQLETPFGKPSGPVNIGKFGDRNVAFLHRHGPGHTFNPSMVPYAANIFALKSLGVRTIIGTGAVGSLVEAIRPGDLVVVDQFIDKTFKRQNSFYDKFGAVHCEFADPVCHRLREKIAASANRLSLKTHPKGTYVCMEGPQFSTRAESHMHKIWGGHLIGMTAMPEAKLAREAQMCYCLIALVSDYDCWRPANKQKDHETLLQEIIANLKQATDNCKQMVMELLESDIDLQCDECTCRKSLQLAVWTQQDKLSEHMKQELAVLFE